MGWSTFAACGCCTRRTGTWAGRCTGSICSTTRRRTWTHLVDVVRAEQVDAVVVAGDVYDRAIPPVEAVTLLSETLARLAEHTTVVVTSGNHDSATRLGFGSALMRDRVRLRTRVAGLAEPVVLPDDDGDVLVYGIPYLDPDFARVELADGPEPLARSHEAVAAAAMRRIRADVASAARAPARPRTVVAAHAFVIGGAPTRVRAGHPRRRRRPGAGRRVRGRGLRRARAPARPAEGRPAPTARSCATAARRSRTRSPSSTTPSRPCWWTCPAARCARTLVDAPGAAPAGGRDRHARGAAGRRRRARTPTTGCG